MQQGQQIKYKNNNDQRNEQGKAKVKKETRSNTKE